MERYVKFLKRLPRPLRAKLLLTIDKIAKDNLKGLDIKRLEGNRIFYRCRIGKIRIVFEKKEGGNTIYDVGFRGNIY